MDNSTTTIQGETLLINQLELVAPTTVAGTLYGIALTLFCLYVHSLVSRLQDSDRKRQAKFMLVYSTVIMLCGLFDLVSNAWLAQDAYIKHANYPGGPLAYSVTTYQRPLITVMFTCQLLVDTMTSVIQIWRVWVVWSATRYAKLVVMLPLIFFLTFEALRWRSFVLENTLPFSELKQSDLRTEIAGIAIQAATTMLCTALISLFLIFKQWQQRRLIGKAQGSAGYMKTVAMLIESYALESIWLLIGAVIIQAEGAFFQETQIYIEIIAYLLVQYRVASGKTHESHREQTNISSLHWNHSHHASTQLAESDAGEDRHLSIKREAPDVSGDSSMA